jgi:hypothetical protein
VKGNSWPLHVVVLIPGRGRTRKDNTKLQYVDSTTMKTMGFNCWSDLQEWLRRYKDGQKEFAFRGQADSAWPLQTSLARYFLAHTDTVMPNHWRRRELKMYRIFRERLVHVCPGMYKTWDPLDILSLMQHHHCPTRMLDFTFCPGVAAYFALKDTQGESAIWVVDTDFLGRRRVEKKLADYCGPKHDPYDVFHKEKGEQYEHVGSIRVPERLNERLTAQRGCFFVPGSISKTVEEGLVHSKVILSEGLAIESLSHLSKLGFDWPRLFSDLDKLAQQASRFSVTGAPDFPEPGHDAGTRR